MKTLAAIVIFCPIAVGCAGSVAHDQMMQRSGTVRIDPGPAADLLRVTVRNDVDFGFDPDRLDDRRGAAARALRQQCGGVDFLSEQVIDGGTNFVGRTLRTYVITVRCQARPAS